MSLKGNILIVDDELQALKLLEYSLKKAFVIQSARSGEEGLEIIRSGFNPGVIFSDLMMPGMYGTEFLKKTIDLVPDASRIIVTAHDSTKEIIAAINHAHAYMFIKKPYDNLEIFQAAVIAIDRYDKINLLRESAKNETVVIVDESSNNQQFTLQIDELKYQLDEEIKEKKDLENELNDSKNEIIKLKDTIDIKNSNNEQLERKIERLRTDISENDSFDHESALAFSAFVRENEKFWFTDHTYNVSVIVKAMAKKMELDHYMTENIITGSLLHNISITSMPDYLKFADPNNLNDILKEKYFSSFTRTMKILQKIKRLRRFSTIISQIWEHQDGSGNPKNLPGSKIRIESQIIALANCYHTNVYGLTQEKYKDLLNRGIVTQTKAETENRHKETLKYFYKKAAWFDKISIQTLHELTNDKECPSLIPIKEELILDMRDHYSLETKIESIKSPVDYPYDEELMIDTNKIALEENLVPTEIEPGEVKPGMKLVEHLKTVNGITIVKADTLLDAEHVKKIKQFDIKGTLADKVYVLLPQD